MLISIYKNKIKKVQSLLQSLPLKGRKAIVPQTSPANRAHRAAFIAPPFRAQNPNYNIIKMRQRPEEMVSFDFPQTEQEFLMVKSCNDLKEKIERERSFLELTKSSIRYKVVEQKNRYIYARCRWRKCPAVLKYVLSE